MQLETMKNIYDIIVIGGGHAGVEAATSAARMGAEVALITVDSKKIGVISEYKYTNTDKILIGLSWLTLFINLVKPYPSFEQYP